MNHLSAEKSPYLEQHVDNPVDWYPWADQAFRRAVDDNKLIFLSIGYSTCHWCHVMAHECFEDDEVAALLNRDYISIKVDREERPDIDQVYMEVCQRMTGHGGWPLTIIMTPDAQPFYAATYIPKHGQHGRPGLMDLLPWVSGKWQNEPGLLLTTASELVKALQQTSLSNGLGSINLDMHAEAQRSLAKSYDPRFGGFGKRPKFPRPHDLTFLLQRYQTTDNADCLEMAEQTLQSMRHGGIFDQLGFGFHRYATDDKWLVPHFEKMLYDQAGLSLAYLKAWQVTGKTGYAATVEEILTYLQRDMLSREGAFYSAEDADSEGVEGKFYLWTLAEIHEVLGDEAQDFCAAYHVTAAGNYLDEMTDQLNGRNILHRRQNPVQSSGASYQVSSLVRNLLLAEREKRVRPHLDDKVLTAWNGMAISAFAQAGTALNVPAYLECARRAAAFILSQMRDGQRLYRRYRDGEAAISAFSEDYAFFARGLLDLYAATFCPQDLQQAIQIAGQLQAHFQDPATGKLYDTPSDGEALLIRPSSAFDGAMPSASSVTVEVFARLFLLTGDLAWKTSAESLMSALAPDVSRYPAGFTQTLQSACWLLEATREVVIVGAAGDPAAEQMLSIVRSADLSRTVVLFKSVHSSEVITSLAPFTASMTADEGQARAYVCQNFSCREPVSDGELLRQLLGNVPEQQDV